MFCPAPVLFSRISGFLCIISCRFVHDIEQDQTASKGSLHIKANEEILCLIQNRRWQEVRWAALERLTEQRLDPQVWTFLGQAMVGLGQGKMGELCFRRVMLLDPFVRWLETALRDAADAAPGEEDKEVLALLDHPRPTVSAVILTCNSERTVRSCLGPLQDAVDEIIVVDTGSTDETVSIVESLGIEVYSFEWRDDFAAARNYAQTLATCDWIIMIDSDEVLLERDKAIIRETAGVYSGLRHPVGIRAAILNTIQGNVFPTFMVRMFPADDRLHWKGRIHEQLLSSDPLPIRTAHIEFLHDGYDSAKAPTTNKWERNVRLLNLALQESPENSALYYYLGRELMHLERMDEAETALKRSVALSDSSPTQAHLAARTYSELINLLLKRHDTAKAADTARKMLQLMPDHPDGWGWLALMERSLDLARSYHARIQNNNGRYRYNFDLALKLRAVLPEVFRE